MRTGTLTVLLGLGVAACSTPTRPTSSDRGTMATGTALSAAPSGPATASTSGGGHFELTLASGEIVDVQFGMTAVTTGAGGAAGHFTHRAVLGGLVVEFQGRVTCLAVDAVNRRAWVGGVITQNTSEHPSFTTPRTQPGRDIWFRVLDSGEGQAVPDRSTFVGFEGDAGIITSQEYCDTKPWPLDNARTWPLVAGNIQIRP
jgi:hypothetical protein